MFFSEESLTNNKKLASKWRQTCTVSVLFWMSNNANGQEWENEQVSEWTNGYCGRSQRKFIHETVLESHIHKWAVRNLVVKMTIQEFHVWSQVIIDIVYNVEYKHNENGMRNAPVKHTVR